MVATTSSKKANPLSVRQRAIAEGYRSGLEEKVGHQLDTLGIKAKYESFKIKFTEPEKNRSYTPDWLLPNGIIIETKGRFITADRQKHLLVKQQHPHLDIRFVFSNSKTKLSKTSPTKYSDWCEKHGFKYADKTIPQGWLDEEDTRTRS
jgi:hypothetical protein